MNLLEETKKILTKHGHSFGSVEWAAVGRLFFDYENCVYNMEKICLAPEHTEKCLDVFLKTIDFDYDNGFGGQNVFGKVMLVDGSWLERAEYDGAEWWEYKERVSFVTAKNQLDDCF